MTPPENAACGCNPAGPGPDNSWPDGPPFYSEDCPVHGRQPALHDTNTCPDEDCPACIQGCLGCRRKYVRTINGYCSRCVENEVWRAPTQEARHKHERNLLADALGRVLVAAGVATDQPLTGPQLLLLADDYIEHLTGVRP